MLSFSSLFSNEKMVFTITWEIENFSVCACSYKEKVCSPCFYSPENHKSKWCLSFYPRGYENRNYTSYFLHRVANDGGPGSVTLSFRLAVIAADGSVEGDWLEHTFIGVQAEGWGKPLFKKRTDLLGTEKAKLLPMDTLTLRCDIRSLTKAPISKKRKDLCDEASMSHNFDILYQNREFSDLTLICGNEEFHVHKTILFARAKKFAKALGVKDEVDISDAIHDRVVAALIGGCSKSQPDVCEGSSSDCVFNCNTTSQKSHRVQETDVLVSKNSTVPNVKEIFDIEPVVLETLLSYLYSGKVKTFPHSYELRVFDVAKKYELHDLIWKLRPCPNEYVIRTRIAAERRCFTWPIKNFSSLPADEKQYYPVLLLSLLLCLRFELVLTRNAMDDEVLDISVNLSCSDEEKDILLRCKISVTIASLTSDYFKEYEYRFRINATGEDCKTYNFGYFIKKKDIHRRKHSYLSEDTLSLSFELAVSVGQKTTIEAAKISAESYATFCSCQNDMGRLCSDFESLYLSGQLNDVCLLSKNGRRFRAHRNILCARSPVFCRMFASQVVEKQSGTVNISDVEDDVLDAMLIFIYSGKLEIPNYKCALKLYEVAHKYEIPTLQRECALALKSILTVENVVEVLINADAFGDETLKSLAQNFICSHYSEVHATASWQNLIRSKSFLTVEILLQLKAEKNSA